MIEGLAEVGCLLVLQGPGEPFQASGYLLLIVGAGLTAGVILVIVPLWLWVRHRRARSPERFDAWSGNSPVT